MRKHLEEYWLLYFFAFGIVAIFVFLRANGPCKVTEIEESGCRYLVFRDPGNGYFSVIHKANCPNHSVMLETPRHWIQDNGGFWTTNHAN